MNELLHDLHALAEVRTTFPPAARRWAGRLLALWAPDLLGDGPLDGPDLGVLALAGQPSTVEAVRAAVSGEASPSVARLWVELLGWGAVDPSTAREAALEGLSADGSPADVWRALVIARTGPVLPQAVRAASAVSTPALRPVAAAVVLHAAANKGQLQAVVDPVMDALTTPNACRDLVLALGGRLDPCGTDDPATAAASMLERIGAQRPLPKGQGARRRRAARLAQALLHGRQDPLSAVLRAITTRAVGLPPADLVAEAAWWAGFAEGPDPIVDVIERGAVRRPDRIAAARRRVTPKTIPARPAHPGAAVLALATDPERVAPALLDHARIDGPDAHPYAAAATPWLADRVPELLGGPHRDLGLALAVWCPTSAVAEALIALPVPHEPTARRRWGHALAIQGEPVSAEYARAASEVLPPVDRDAIEGLLDALSLAR